MTTFVVIGAVGLLLLVVSLVLGDLIDGVVDGFGPDWLSGTALAAFLAALGFGGALALQLGASQPAAIGAGVAAGAVAGVLAGVVTRSLTNEVDRVTPTSGALVGASATVVSDVPEDGYGTISLVVAGHPTRLNARSGHALRTGTQVRVSAVLSSTSVQVEPLAASGDARNREPS